MKFCTRVMGALLMTLACAALQSQRVEAKTIYIGVSNPDMSFLSGGVAKFQGYFKDEGLDVEVLQMNANVSVAALAAGNIDYNLILQSVVTANLRGLPLKVAGILIERPNHVVVAHPSIQKFADLKGKKIAISSFGSLVDILARLTSSHFKLDPRSEVQYVAAGSSSARVAQLQAGVVQAAFVTPPGNLRAEAAGFKSLLRVGDLFAFPVNGIGLHEQKLRNDRDEVRKVTRALLRANRFILDNPKGAIKILAAWGRSKPEVAEEAYQFSAQNYSRNLLVSRATLENVIESTRWNVETQKKITVDDVFELSLVREILKEMGEAAK
jgi:NitT/TauT family transport system substrate-binding protein